jgi:hypothetical protein
MSAQNRLKKERNDILIKPSLFEISLSFLQCRFYQKKDTCLFFNKHSLFFLQLRSNSAGKRDVSFFRQAKIPRLRAIFQPETFARPKVRPSFSFFAIRSGYNKFHENFP